MKKITTIFVCCALFLGVKAQTPYWNTAGNGGNTSTEFIGTTDNVPLVFKIRNIERMRLNTEGAFLGVGVNNPLATLHLHYQQQGTTPDSQKLLQLTTDATGNATNNGFAVFSDYTTKEIRFKQQESAKFFIEGKNGGMVIAQDGKIGVGTDAPKEKVHINDGNLLISATSASTINIIQMGVNESYWNIERLNSKQDGYGLNFKTVESNTTSPGERVLQSTSVLFLGSNGKIGVGTKTPTATLEIKGSLRAKDTHIDGLLCTKEVHVRLSGAPCWPDYVFGKNYNLMPLKELEQFVNENQHLPEIPSAATVEEKGIELGEMNAKLLKKVEELTLYLLQQEKKMLELQKQIDELKNR